MADVLRTTPAERRSYQSRDLRKTLLHEGQYVWNDKPFPITWNGNGHSAEKGLEALVIPAATPATEERPPYLKN